MCTKVIKLDGGIPWGFRFVGGTDFNSPVRITKVIKITYKIIQCRKTTVKKAK